MNIALVDDDPEDLQALAHTLRAYGADRDVPIELSPFSSGEALLQNYRPWLYTVIFLDIYLSGLSGIEVAKRLRGVDDDTILVFLTKSCQHQRDAIHYHAYDYLSKTEAPRTVYDVLDRILAHHPTLQEKCFTFRCGRRTRNLQFADIVAVESSHNNIVITTRSGETYSPRMTFASACKQLSPDGRFLEILRGVLVNMAYITDISENTCVLEGDLHLPISHRNRRNILHIWQNYCFCQPPDNR